MIVYGKAPLMFTKYCPLEKMNQCGTCRRSTYELKDKQGAFPIISHDDCTTTILNGKTLNILDEIKSIEGIEAFRLNFTVESKDQVVEIINKALGKLNGSMNKTVFNQETDTRGHFNKEIL
jgi:putative protease